MSKILKYQISWDSIQWELSCYIRTDGHTDTHDEANSRFSRCCERVWKWHAWFCLFRNLVIWVRWSCEIMELGDTLPCVRNFITRYLKCVDLWKHLFKLATAMSWPLCVCFRPPFAIKNSQTQQESTTFLYPVLQVPIPCCNIKNPAFYRPYHGTGGQSSSCHRGGPCSS